MPGHNANKRNAPPTGLIGILLALIAITLVLIAPVFAAIVSALLGARADDIAMWFTFTRAMLLLKSIVIAGIIGGCSLALGLPLARALISGPGRGSAILLAPVWLPSILLYAAFNLARSPDTIIGNALITLASNGHRWVPIWSGYVLAGAGLALWASPIAAILLATDNSGQSALLHQQLRLEQGGFWVKSRLWIGAKRSQLARVWILMTILFLGSAVPMHLAQFDTWSIVLWRELSQRGPDNWGAIWIGALPMMLIACIGSWVVLRMIRDVTKDPTLTTSTPPPPMPVPMGVRVGAWTVWSCAVVVPMIAMIWSIRDPRSILYFWKLQGPALRSSSLVAIVAGVLSIGIALCVAYGVAHPSATARRCVKLIVCVLAFLGLVPGVLVGAAVASSSVQGMSAVYLATGIRTACVGAIVGALVGAGEPGSRKALRWTEGSVGIRAWMQTQLPLIAFPILGAGVAAALLALCEIEASVMVRPPGVSNLPQQLLSDLHYARLEELSAAGVNLLAIGVLVGIIPSAFVFRFRTTISNHPSPGE